MAFVNALAKEVEKIDDRELTDYLNTILLFKRFNGYESWRKDVIKARGRVDSKHKDILYKIDVYLYSEINDYIHIHYPCNYMREIKEFLIRVMKEYENPTPRKEIKTEEVKSQKS